MNIDGKDHHLPTFRSMIMEMTTNEKKSLFIGLDMFWDETISFVFPKKYETEARNCIADLGSFLHHKHGDKVLIFT